MALPRNYRWIAVGNVRIRNRKNAKHFAPEWQIADLIDALKDRIKRGAARRLYSKKSRMMWCDHVTETDRFYHLLLQVGDKNVTGVSFVDFPTMTTRDIEKKEDEGGHYAAHILIKKATDPLGGHLILIEKVPGIYFASVKDHFAWACRDPLYEKVAQDDDGANVRFKASFDIVGHQSKTIREALQTGILQDVEFISHEQNFPDGLDEDGIIEEVEHEARWKIKKRVNDQQAKGIFKRVPDFIKGLKGGVDHTQIFVRIKADNGQIKRTEVQHNGEEILEQAFVQNEIVSDFDPPLTQRYEKFRDDMIEKMTKLANSLGA